MSQNTSLRRYLTAGRTEWAIIWCTLCELTGMLMTHWKFLWLHMTRAEQCNTSACTVLRTGGGRQLPQSQTWSGFFLMTVRYWTWESKWRRGTKHIHLSSAWKQFGLFGCFYGALLEHPGSFVLLCPSGENNTHSNSHFCWITRSRRALCMRF